MIDTNVASVSNAKTHRRLKRATDVLLSWLDQPLVGNGELPLLLRVSLRTLHWELGQFLDTYDKHTHTAS